MRNSLNIKDAKRSIQTIRDCTRVIATHFFGSTELQVRTLNNEALVPEDLKFIVTFADDVKNAHASVKPLAEARFLNGEVCFTVNPAKQFPEMANKVASFSEVIETSIREFLSRHDSIVSTNIANDSGKWLLH
ncbi:hypothetical protein NS303_17690 [Pantoea ananatis]|uniref:hypothetical protein n=1 Tax=Pantoea TaxID=53335 RepID=UPI0006D08D6B|nr:MULTISPECIES: hypothetical protein [Pantoea]KTR46876.1 hypothetical protein NS303_17690 [Pantoea ananatis]KTR55746.1 hypothetical protein NS311_10435 [Pantoea ananatis]KTR62067.1 hypothetical protein RSA47_21750 [Pantoea ananatis]KTR69425.1 hypothetical protein NS296_15085 [Pantoea ananatis]